VARESRTSVKYIIPDKVVCFDTLLQVLILQEMEERSGIRRDEMGSPSRMVSRLEGKGPAGGMPPRVFCKKSVEVIENKGSEWEKERKEKSRVRNSVKLGGLRMERRDE